MLYRKLGRTQLNVSVIGLGGEPLIPMGESDVAAMLDGAIQQGINYLDLFMPQPETRTAIGHALAGKRDKMYIQGHLCTVMQGDQYERTRDIDKVKASFEDLLARLQTDYVDVGMIHYVDSFDDYDAIFNGPIMAYAQQLKAKGVIKHIGLSSHNPLVSLKAVESGLIDVLMFSINAAYDLEKPDSEIEDLMEFKDLGEDGWSVEPARQALYAACARLGVGITVMKALGAGSLLKDESSPFQKAMTVTQCCHYCLTRPGVTSVLVGCGSQEELLNAAAYVSASEEEKDYAHILSGNSNVKISGRCMYCNHCQPCPSGIDIAAVTKFLDIAKEQKEVPETVLQHYTSLSKNASDCIMCGQCEPNCPFGVQVRANMEEAQSVFDKNLGALPQSPTAF